MERPMSEYAADAPRILRDFLTYISTIQGKSARTAHEYYLDLRLFLRVLKHNKGLVPRELPIDRIAIDDIDIDFLKTVILSVISRCRTPMIIWNTCPASAPRSRTVRIPSSV